MWNDCKKILCVRADNMGDVIMTGPALQAVKDRFGAEITLLTSSAAQSVAPYIPAVSRTIIADLPWVQQKKSVDNDYLIKIVDQIREEHFDAAILFTVYSQSALPAALICTMAGIPLRLAYCRENPYGLLTDWVPDAEPYAYIRHQVQRDLDLVDTVGARAKSDRLILQVKREDRNNMQQKMVAEGVDPGKPFIILHPGVSEEKRKYPIAYWIEIGKLLSVLGYPLLVTGVAGEQKEVTAIVTGIDSGAISLAGVFDTGEFIALVDAAALAITVNTATSHIAAATETPVIVLYALTNPQHTPWRANGRIFSFPVPANLWSRNEIIRYVQRNCMPESTAYPSPSQIASAARDLLSNSGQISIRSDAMLR